MRWESKYAFPRLLLTGVYGHTYEVTLRDAPGGAEVGTKKDHLDRPIGLSYCIEWSENLASPELQAAASYDANISEEVRNAHRLDPRSYHSLLDLFVVYISDQFSHASQRLFTQKTANKAHGVRIALLALLVLRHLLMWMVCIGIGFLRPILLSIGYLLTWR